MLVNTSYAAVRFVAESVLAGRVVQASGVTVGSGFVIDWRTVKSGEEIQCGADAFDSAQLFVALVGAEAAIAGQGAVPEVTAYMLCANGGRLRSFTVGGLRVSVDPHDDDTLQEWFTHELAKMAASI